MERWTGSLRLRRLLAVAHRSVGGSHVTTVCFVVRGNDDLYLCHSDKASNCNPFTIVRNNFDI